MAWQQLYLLHQLHHHASPDVTGTTYGSSERRREFLQLGSSLSLTTEPEVERMTWIIFICAPVMHQGEKAITVSSMQRLKKKHQLWLYWLHKWGVYQSVLVPQYWSGNWCPGIGQRLKWCMIIWVVLCMMSNMKLHGYWPASFLCPTAQWSKETQEKGTHSTDCTECDIMKNIHGAVIRWVVPSDPRVTSNDPLWVFTPQIAAVDEDGREDKATIKCETSPPPTPRTVRMTHTLPASSHNDARGWVSAVQTPLRDRAEAGFLFVCFLCQK